MPYKRITGLCVDCHATARPNKTLCAECADKRSKRKKKNYRRTSEDGICVLCKKAPARIDRSRCQKCGERSTRNGRRYRTGVSAEDYAQQLLAQHNKCAICSEMLSEGPGEAAADHCHATQKFRGVLCRGCNTGLGMFQDNLYRVAAALEYLQKGGVR